MNQSCPNCDHENRATAQFCENCGTSLASVAFRKCPHCGQEVSESASFCPECGTDLCGVTELETEERAARSAPAERKPVTIFFADIVGSTEKAEVLDPEEWREVVAGAHERVGQAVGRYEGTVAQLLGDGVLAFFGAPVTHEDDPERAVRAALDLQESIQAYAEELAGYVDGFAMRVGIHAGTVVVGEIGSEEKSEYLAVGDAVNVAARLEGAAEPGQIVISEQIARRVRASFELKDLGPIQLRGKADGDPAFAVVEEKAVPDRARGLETAERVFVGRKRELENLQQALLDLCRGHGQIRFILGEAGIGKSRLVEELREHPPENPSGEQFLVTPEQVRWLEARALSYGGSLSYWPVSQLLLADLGLSDGAPAPQLKAVLGKRTGQVLGDRAGEVRPYLSRLLGLKLEAEEEARLSQYDSETLGREIRRAILAYFEALADQSPAVLVVEDLHWADDSSLEVLRHMLSVTNRAPLMILGLMRVERDHGSWDLKVQAERDVGHRYGEIPLNPLAGGEAGQILVSVLGSDSEWGDVAELVLDRAEGNPFYLEELLRHLLERELIVLENDSWKLTAELERVGVPDTLQGVLLARIDRLEEDVQQTLQLASVIGRSFLYRILAAISEAERELDRHLDHLQRVDLVREKTRLPELEYMFKHGLTQEATYKSLLAERRKQFHRRVGQAVEDLFSDRLGEFFGLLAHHYEAAGELDRAIEFLTQAANQARWEDSLAEAKELLRRLIKLANQSGDTQLEAQTWMKLALVHQIDFEFHKAHEAYEEAFQAGNLAVKEAEDMPETRSEPMEFTAELRMPVLMRFSPSVDLANPRTISDSFVLRNVQAGLASLDQDLNVVPHAARSWEVHDGGRRYVFHLRENVFWSDGSRVKADDFIGYWRWQLARQDRPTFSWLNVIERVGEAGGDHDADSLALRALDDTSFEVRLKQPMVHLLYLMVDQGYPAPGHQLEMHGMDWWRPPHGLYSGPYVIQSIEEAELVFQRNPFYFGSRQGNVEVIRFIGFRSPEDWARAYIANEVDFCWNAGLPSLGGALPEAEIAHAPSQLATEFILFNPHRAPTSDRRVRAALANAVDRRGPLPGPEDRSRPADGGIVPAGIPGHSPELAIQTEVERAKQLLRSATRDNAGPFGELIVAIPYADEDPQHYLKPWVNQLNLNLQFETYASSRIDELAKLSPHICLSTWVADYPDPHNFLVTMVSRIYDGLGWSDPTLDDLIEKAVRAKDRKSRLASFRELDRYLVREQVLAVPVRYGGEPTYLVKPWVKGYQVNGLDLADLKDVTVA